MMTKRTSRLNFLVDLVAGLAFILTVLSGKSYVVHIAAALVFTAFVAVHLFLHWDWLTGCSRRLFAGSLANRGRVRLNYEIDVFILVMFVISTATGLTMIMSGNGTTIAKIHGLSSWLFVLGGMLHVALHGDWVVMMVKRGLRRPTGRVSSSWSV
jgi:Ca2+/Na+ antiporter